MLETDAGLLSGHGCTEEHGPFLVVDDLATTPWQRHRVTLCGETFTLAVENDAPRLCTGRHDLERRQSEPCPRAAQLSPSAAQQCRECFEATGFNPAFYHARSVSPQQQRRNRQPHVVYLAWFGPGVVKVGMSLAARGSSRLLEQGARLGVALHEYPDADQARQLEAELARELGVVEVVRSARKRHLLGIPIDVAGAREQLKQFVQQARCLRPEMGEPTLLELDRHRGTDDLLARPLTDLTNTLPPRISGRCLGMVGDVLITEYEGKRFMLSLGESVGRRIRSSATPGPNRVSGQLAFGF